MARQPRFLVYSQFIKVFINLLQTLFNTSHLMADGIEQNLGHKLGANQGVEECVAVNRNGNQHSGILGQKSAGLIP